MCPCCPPLPEQPILLVGDVILPPEGSRVHRGRSPTEWRDIHQTRPRSVFLQPPPSPRVHPHAANTGRQGLEQEVQRGECCDTNTGGCSEEGGQLEMFSGLFVLWQVDALFQEDFNKSPEQLFKTFDYEPLAAASLAQVHKAELFDGTPVAVKVSTDTLRAFYHLCIYFCLWHFHGSILRSTHIETRFSIFYELKVKDVRFLKCKQSDYFYLNDVILLFTNCWLFVLVSTSPLSKMIHPPGSWDTSRQWWKSTIIAQMCLVPVSIKGKLQKCCLFLPQVLWELITGKLTPEMSTTAVAQELNIHLITLSCLQQLFQYIEQVP